MIECVKNTNVLKSGLPSILNLYIPLHQVLENSPEVAVEGPHSGPVVLLQTGAVGEEVLPECAPSPHQQWPVHHEHEVVDQVEEEEEEEDSQETEGGRGRFSREESW